MKQYWVSAIIKDSEDKEPWLCAMTDGVLSFDKAMEVVNKTRENYIVLSAWIDVFDENGVKNTVFHECYINKVNLRVDDTKEKLKELLMDYFSIGDSYCYNLTRDKSAFSVGTMDLDDFEEFDESIVDDIVDFLSRNWAFAK